MCLFLCQQLGFLTNCKFQKWVVFILYPFWNGCSNSESPHFHLRRHGNPDNLCKNNSWSFYSCCVESVASQAVLAFCLGLFCVALAEYHRLGDLDTTDMYSAHCFGDWEVKAWRPLLVRTILLCHKVTKGIRSRWEKAAEHVLSGGSSSQDNQPILKNSFLITSALLNSPSLPTVALRMKSLTLWDTCKPRHHGNNPVFKSMNMG